jgi:HPt (histidine-containing phosphotransfer) domain-containing protein
MDLRKGDQEPADRPEPDDEDFGLAELIPQYLALCRRDLLNLGVALDNKQFEDVRVLGHNLKGSGGAYGFPELSEIGSRIETAAKEKDEAVARQGIEQLEVFLRSHDPAE